MTEKVLLIEDRVNRQSNYAIELGIEKFAHPLLMNICGGAKFQEFYDLLEAGNHSSLNEFMVIIIHRSCISSAARQGIIDYCVNNKKPLVFFSGGISMDSLNEIKQTPFLTLNSKTLYSSNLKTFLDGFSDSGKPNLAILLFGENWAVNYLLGFRSKLIHLMHDNRLNRRNIPSDVFKNLIGLTTDVLESLSAETHHRIQEEKVEQPMELLKVINQEISVLITKRISPYENFVC